MSDDVPGAALITAHHDRKAESADFIDAVSGSNGLAGSADTIVLLSRARHDLNGTRAADVATALDLDAKTAGTYLARLADKGRIDRPAPGLYTPVRTPMESVVGVESGDTESNTSHTITPPHRDDGDPYDGGLVEP